MLAASVAATKTFPCILQVLCQGLFGREATRAASMASKIHVASLALRQWTLQQCERALLDTVLGPVLFPTLVCQLPCVDTAGDVENRRTWRHGIYRALSILAHWSPALVASSDDAFQLLLAQSLDQPVHGEALQTLTSFARAYAAGATADVRRNVRHALLARVHGATVFEPA
ncbi:hypothetical protein PsorP6_015647 [Peronosclerospora sorghi]|uniref:Uncharacterized protein n=1 Tax=Peronosclerospora sorghi TaxID=230839 RepID=A0ACC0WMK7_9STRA|nr:hypothetical protein PsorP6_015647 [Peronosclerospora sorghi]